MKNIKSQWKILASARNITSTDMVAMCICKSISKNETIEIAKERLLKSFSPIKNNNKLLNGMSPYGALINSMWYIRTSNVAKWLTPEELDKLINTVNLVKATIK